MRVVFNAADLAVNLAALQTGFRGDCRTFSGWSGRCATRATRRRVMLLVSKSDHCPRRYPVSLAHRRTRNDPDPRSFSNHPRETYSNLDLGEISVSFTPSAR